MQWPAASSSWNLIWQNRWLVFVPSLWIQSCAGVGYAYGSYSPLLKTVLGYSQQQITFLGVAKDVGGTLGLPAGCLSEVLPPWCLIAMGAVHYIIGYGGLWIIVTGSVPIPPMWAVCILMLIGTNGDTYLSTSGIVTNVYNFPKSRGHVVGLIKGFNGLCSAIFTQVYMTFFAPDQASYLLLVAAGPSIVSVLMMFFVRRIDSHSERDARPSDALGFYFIYGVCLIMAAYLMGVLILQDVTTVSFKESLVVTIVLLAMVSFLLATPLVTWAAEGMRRRGVVTTCAAAIGERTLDDAEDTGAPLLGGSEVLEQKKNLVSEQEQFTLWQALVSVDSWVLFGVMVCGAGTGLAAINNLGQISQSQGYQTSSIFVSMTSICNFLGRIIGGYISELLARTYKLPRSWALAMAQAMMVVGHILIALGWSGALYPSTVLIGAGFGSHWGVVPPLLSELFGMQNLGILYNVFSMAIPIGVLFFSGFLVGYFYDLEAAKQGQTPHIATTLGSVSTSCNGASCFRLSFLIMSGSCFACIFLTIFLSLRIHKMYKTLYG